MKHSVSVGLLERFGDSEADADGLASTELSLPLPVGQGLAFEVLERQVGEARIFANSINGNDVGMAEARCQACLDEESLAGRRRFKLVRCDELQSDLAPELHVTCGEHLAHAAPA